jgi:hypothetical protein
MVLLGRLLSGLLGRGCRSGSGGRAVCRFDRIDFGTLPGAQPHSLPEAAVVIGRDTPRGRYNIAAMCFVLSGLIMGVLLAGSLKVSAALFVALIVGGSTGFYLSRTQK